MTSQGPYAPTIVEEQFASNEWDYPTTDNVKVEDGVFAKASGFGSGIKSTVGILRCSGLGFTIPVDATIDGILIEVKAKVSPSAHALARFSAMGSYPGISELDTDMEFIEGPTVLTWLQFGGPTSLFNQTFTPAQVNASTFRASVGARNMDFTTFRIIWIDAIRVTVYYSEAVETFPVLSLTASDRDFNHSARARNYDHTANERQYIHPANRLLMLEAQQRDFEHRAGLRSFIFEAED